METIQKIKEAENQIEDQLGRAEKEAEAKIESVQQDFKRKIENVDLSLKDQVDLVFKNAQEKAIEIKKLKEEETKNALRNLDSRAFQKINEAVKIALKELLK